KQLRNRLELPPIQDHMTDNYDDLDTEFDPLLFSSLERYLPQKILNAQRDTKHEFMQQVLRRHATKEDHYRVQKHEEYRQHIISKYEPLYRELYTMNPTMFFVPTFLEAFNADGENIKQSIRSIMSEPVPGVYTFKMLDLCFCKKLIREVIHFEKWVQSTNLRILRPTTSNKFGVCLDDIGMEGTLDKLMEDYINLITKVLFPDVGECSLDSHHGYVLQYGMNRSVDEGFHVDESEVTLNVCLGEEFAGGDLFFGGQRCEEHVNTKTDPKHKFVRHSPIPGQAIIHRGCQRNGAKPTKFGNRYNLLMWCKSSVYRELQKHEKGYKDFCEECQRQRSAKRLEWVAAKKKELGF
ncbi:hypothetical protein M8C21_004443, partial [Ambrosia artemisiifolia]